MHLMFTQNLIYFWKFFQQLVTETHGLLLTKVCSYYLFLLHVGSTQTNQTPCIEITA